jgi:hypothetical protein
MSRSATVGHSEGSERSVEQATLTERRDLGEGRLLERKFDGERCIARKEGDTRAPQGSFRARIP